MKSTKPSSLATVVALLTASAAMAQTVPDVTARLPLEPPAPRKLNRFSLGYLMGFNISASFKNLGGYSSVAPGANPQRTPNGDPYNYANGYIYPDATTSSAHPGYTWYYGYTAGTPIRGTDFDLYRASSRGNLDSSDVGSDPNNGVELTYSRELGQIGKAGWGIEVAGGYLDVNVLDTRNLNGTASRTTDTYRTGGGAQLNPAPQANPFQGPAPGSPGWPLVGLTPVNSSSQAFPGAATVVGSRDFDAQIFSARFGPYIDFPLNNRFTVSLSGGLLLQEIHSDFSFDETVTINPAVTLVGVPGEKHHGSGSDSDLLVGGYASGKISYAISDRFVLFSGAQFRTSGDYSQTVSGKTAKLDLSQAVLVTLGLSYSF
jgi:hypothetical protein